MGGSPQKDPPMAHGPTPLADPSTWKKRPAAMRAACMALMLGSRLPTLRRGDEAWVRGVGWMGWWQPLMGDG
jgi:hypothetical protein